MLKKWVVQHEFDDEPTIIINKDDDGESNRYIQINTEVLPNARYRKQLAEIIACILNMWEN